MIPITTQIWCFDASNGRVEGVQALLVCVVNLSIGGGAFIGGLVSEGAGFSAAIVTGAVCRAVCGDGGHVAAQVKASHLRRLRQSSCQPALKNATFCVRRSASSAVFAGRCHLLRATGRLECRVMNAVDIHRHLFGHRALLD